MEFKDYYATLGVPKTATEKEIKQAFRKLARKYHPDVNPGDRVSEARFKELNEANEVLSDPEKRRKYDELGANWRMYEQQGAGGGGAGSPFGQWSWSSGGGAGGGFRPMTDEEMQDMFGGGEGSFSDFFTTFFGGTGGGAGEAATGARARARSRHQRGRDVEHEIELSLEDALHGTQQRLSVRHDGHARTVDVRIPPGVVDGSRVRVSGEGGRGSGSAASGDLFLRVRLRPHDRFERKGRDLYTKVRLPVTTAVLGGEVEVATLGGKSLRLKVPQTTQNGQVFRLRGHGLPSVGKPDERGDLYATVDIALPEKLSEQERAHWEALARERAP